MQHNGNGGCLVTFKEEDEVERDVTVMSVTYMQSEKRLQVKPASAYKPPVVLETCLLLRPSVSAAGTPRFIRPRLRIDN